MNDLTAIDRTLPSLVDRAASALAGARTAAEVLEARDMAAMAYDAAKRAARFAQAKGAHDSLIAAAHRLQADALAIEKGAERRLADEYNAAHARGEVARDGRPKTLSDRKGSQPDLGLAPASGSAAPPTPPPATTAELGLTYKQVHEARQVHDAERIEPGFVRRTLDRAIERGEEPTRAELRRRQESVLAAIKDAQRPERAPSRRNPHYKPDPAGDRVLRFISLCDDIAGFEDMEALLGWNEREFTAGRLREQARAAWRRLDHFVTLINKERTDT